MLDEQDGEIQITQESHQIAAPSTMRAMAMGFSIIFWILAIFIIIALNNIQAELRKISETMNIFINLSTDRLPENYRLIDKKGNVIYQFQHIPNEYLDGVGFPEGLPPGPRPNPRPQRDDRASPDDAH